MKWMCVIIVLVIVAWQFASTSFGTQTTKPIDFSTIRTQSTLEADTIVIGEVVKISYFGNETYKTLCSTAFERFTFVQILQNGGRRSRNNVTFLNIASKKGENNIEEKYAGVGNSSGFFLYWQNVKR